jgi:hypothetical protein
MNEIHDADKARRVILEIIRQSAGDRIEGKTKLFKAFYFAHLFYAQDKTSYLSEWPIVRMPNGPGIDDFSMLLGWLCRQGFVRVEPCSVGPYTSTSYSLTEQGLREPPLPASELAAVRKAIDFVSDKSGAQLSDITHEYSKSWNDAQDGEELPIYLDLLSDEDYQKSKSAAQEIGGQLREAWG